MNSEALFGVPIPIVHNGRDALLEGILVNDEGLLFGRIRLADGHIEYPTPDEIPLRWEERIKRAGYKLRYKLRENAE